MAGPLLGLYFSRRKLVALLETTLLTLKAASETCDDHDWESGRVVTPDDHGG